MTINLSAVLYLIALILFGIAAFLPPIHPRLSYVAFMLVAGGLFCQATGLGN